MNILIVVQQMTVMLLIILIGYLMFRTNRLNEVSSSHISGLVVNVCNPALLICSAFSDEPKVSGSQLLTALAATLAVYGILLAAGWAIPRLMRIPPRERYIYHFLTVYGNVGFLGIPLVSAVLGGQALIYVSINCLVFNILFYTAGIGIIRKQAGNVQKEGANLSKIINVGTVSALLTILFYLGDFPIPMVVSDTLTYTGRATTFLSMLVLGVSVAQIPLRDMLTHAGDYLFLTFRMILLPIGCVLLLRCFVTDPLILGTSSLLVAVPAANLPLMCSREHGLSTDVLARMIVLTTLFSVVTIPLVVSFL